MLLLEKWARSLANMLDDLRIFPRALVIFYCLWLSMTVKWYISIETIDVIECNAAVMDVLISSESEHKVVEELSCRVVGVTGGPTSQHAAFVSILAGIAPAVFGVYMNTGRRRKEEE